MYQAPAMEPDYRRPFTSIQCLGDQDVDADGMVANVFVGGLNQIEALESGMRRVKSSHGVW